MSAETVLYATLSAAAGVTAIVNTRIYPDQVPQEAALPAIAFARAETEFVNTIHGDTVAKRATLEVWCMAPGRAAAEALGDAVESAGRAAGFMPSGRRPEFDDEAETWAAVLTVDYWET